MLRVNAIRGGSKGAKDYFGHLSAGDYYSDRGYTDGIWGGKLAKKLGLGERVAQSEFFNLCDNLHPLTGEKLTPRTSAQRTVLYDFNFNCPKGVSLMWAFEAPEIKQAMIEVISEVLELIEADVQTRIRNITDANGNRIYADRTTSNALWATFAHYESRSVDGSPPDMNLHFHCTLLNTTFDPVEERFKAVKYRLLKENAPLYEAFWVNKAAWKLQEMGFPIEQIGKFFDIAGIPEAGKSNFSQRTNQIEERAEELGITSDKAKGNLGSKTRLNKKDYKRSDLQSSWESRASDELRKILKDINDNRGGGGNGPDNSPAPTPSPEFQAECAQAAVAYSVKHHFERNTVVKERELIESALRHAMGLAKDEAVLKAYNEHGLIRRQQKGYVLVTTMEVRKQELDIIRLIQDNMGVLPALAGGRTHTFKNEHLNEGQQMAVNHILNSNDRFVSVQGSPGVGKSWCMEEVVEAIKEYSGKDCVMTAPTINASRKNLREAGFKEADTLQSLLANQRRHKSVSGQIIMIDEASMMDYATMIETAKLAIKHDARVVCFGDDKQLPPIGRGNAMRLSHREAGLKPVMIDEILRQRANPEYLAAVQAFEVGNYRDALERFRDMGSIVEIGDSSKRFSEAAKDYVETQYDLGLSATNIVPSHKNIRAITEEIRKELRERKILKGDDRTLNRLENKHWSEAEKGNVRNYEAGQIIQLNQNLKGGFKRGERIRILGRDQGGNLQFELLNGRKTNKPLDLSNPERLQVYGERDIALAIGDSIRITQNYKSGKVRLDNGSHYTVKRFTNNGFIELNNGVLIRNDFGHLDHGYLATAPGGQGDSNEVAQGSMQKSDYLAVSTESVRVILTRGKEDARFYTDDFEALVEAAERSAVEQSAGEFMNDPDAHDIANPANLPGKDNLPEAEPVNMEAEQPLPEMVDDSPAPSDLPKPEMEESKPEPLPDEIPETDKEQTVESSAPEISEPDTEISEVEAAENAQLNTEIEETDPAMELPADTLETAEAEVETADMTAAALELEEQRIADEQEQALEAEATIETETEMDTEPAEQESSPSPESDTPSVGQLDDNEQASPAGAPVEKEETTIFAEGDEKSATEPITENESPSLESPTRLEPLENETDASDAKHKSWSDYIKAEDYDKQVDIMPRKESATNYKETLRPNGKDELDVKAIVDAGPQGDSYVKMSKDEINAIKEQEAAKQEMRHQDKVSAKPSQAPEVSNDLYQQWLSSRENAPPSDASAKPAVDSNTQDQVKQAQEAQLRAQQEQAQRQAQVQAQQAAMQQRQLDMEK